MDDNIYLKLCNHLNKYPLWAPPTDAFLEILQIMFTPEEAEFALFFPPALKPSLKSPNGRVKTRNMSATC